MIGEITYGNVFLEMTWINRVSRIPVYSQDGVDYLYTEITIDVVCVYSPSATSYKGDGGSATPEEQAGNYAGTTDIALRNYLETPRRLLTIKYGDKNGNYNPWIQSPRRLSNGANPMPCDSKGVGPICKVNDVVSHDGTKTWTLNLVFTTWINDCNKTSPIISHRWSKHEFVDENYRSTVITRGRCVCDAGKLRQAGRNADFFRDEFFHPIGLNQKRKVIDVDVSEDGASIDYQVIDEQQFYNLGAAAFTTRLEVSLTTTVSTVSGLARAANAASGMRPVVQSGLGSPQSGLSLSHWWNQIVGHDNAVASSQTFATPKFFAKVDVRAFGAPNMSRRNMYLMAMRAIWASVRHPPLIRAAYMADFSITQDKVGKIVSAYAILRWSREAAIRIAQLFPIAGTIYNEIFLFGGQMDPAGPFLDAQFPEDEDLYVSPKQSGSVIAAPYNSTGARMLLGGNGNSEPAGLNGSFGFGSVRELVIQELSRQCETPPVPPAVVVPRGELL